MGRSAVLFLGFPGIAGKDAGAGRAMLAPATHALLSISRSLRRSPEHRDVLRKPWPIRHIVAVPMRQQIGPYHHISRFAGNGGHGQTGYIRSMGVTIRGLGLNPLLQIAMKPRNTLEASLVGGGTDR